MAVIGDVLADGCGCGDGAANVDVAGVDDVADLTASGAVVAAVSETESTDWATETGPAVAA